MIIASAYLPVDVEKIEKEDGTSDWQIRSSIDTVYNNLYHTSKNYPKVIWIGFLKNYYIIPEDEREQVRNMLKKQHLYCIHVKLELLSKYQDFMKTIFISIFQHYSVFKDIPTIRNYDSYWKAYTEFNDSIAKAIVSNITEKETLILVNDYNLLLTPSYIHHNLNLYNKLNGSISIGLFMHRPFPGSDVFHRFPNREDVLKSMMNCSCIFFNTYEGTRNFITNCKRSNFVNFESTKKGDLALNYFGRNVIIEVKQLFSDPSHIEVSN